MNLLNRLFGTISPQGMKEKGDIDGLLRALGHKEWPIRRDGVKMLAELGDARAVESLIVALKDPIGYVRQEAAVALGKLGDGRALDPLIAALETRDRYVVVEAAAALGKLGDGRALDPLIAALKDRDESVRAGVITSLARLGDGRAVKPLTEALKDRKGSVRLAAEEALPSFLPAEEVAKYIQEAAIGRHISALVDPDRDVRLAAAHALNELQDHRALEPLVAALKDEHWGVRQAAAIALGSLEDPRIAGHLQELVVGDRAAAVRQAAAAALEKYVSPVEVLFQRSIGDLKDDLYTQVRVQAAEKLGELGDPRAIQPLMAALDANIPQVRAAAAAALKRLGGPEANSLEKRAP